MSSHIYEKWPGQLTLKVVSAEFNMKVYLFTSLFRNKSCLGDLCYARIRVLSVYPARGKRLFPIILERINFLESFHHELLSGCLPEIFSRENVAMAEGDKKPVPILT